MARSVYVESGENVESDTGMRGGQRCRGWLDVDGDVSVTRMVAIGTV